MIRGRLHFARRCARVLAALIALSALPPHPVFAQRTAKVTTESSPGLRTTAFETPQGRVTVYLPDDARPGDMLSGAVIAEPAGTTPRERTRNAGRLEGYVVDLDGERTPVGEGVLRWTVPAQPARGAARLTLWEAGGRELGNASAPLQAGPSPPPASPAELRLPRVGQSGNAVQIQGPFDGDLGTAAVTIGGREARKLAESPRQLVVQSPPDVVGPTTIELRERDSAVRGEYRGVSQTLSAGKLTLQRGETTTMRDDIRGLAELREPIEVRIENRSTDVVRLEGGDSQTFTIRPQDVQRDGTFVLTRTLTGLRPGGFVITSSVHLPEERQDEDAVTVKVVEVQQAATHVSQDKDGKDVTRYVSYGGKPIEVKFEAKDSRGHAVNFAGLDITILRRKGEPQLRVLLDKDWEPLVPFDDSLPDGVKLEHTPGDPAKGTLTLDLKELPEGPIHVEVHARCKEKKEGRTGASILIAGKEGNKPPKIVGLEISGDTERTFDDDLKLKKGKADRYVTVKAHTLLTLKVKATDENKEDIVTIERAWDGKNPGIEKVPSSRSEPGNPATLTYSFEPSDHELVSEGLDKPLKRRRIKLPQTYVLEFTAKDLGGLTDKLKIGVIVVE